MTYDFSSEPWPVSAAWGTQADRGWRPDLGLPPGHDGPPFIMIQRPQPLDAVVLD